MDRQIIQMLVVGSMFVTWVLDAVNDWLFLSPESKGRALQEQDISAVTHGEALPPGRVSATHVSPLLHSFSLTFCALYPQRHQRQVQMAHCLHLFEQWRRKWNLNPFIEQRTSITEVTPFANPTQCTQCSHSPHEHLSPKGFFSDLKLLLVMLYGP